MSKTPITVAKGDGIGPEIMEATLRILEAAKAEIEIEEIEIGEAVYKRGFSSGIEPAAFESLKKTGVFLKAPITTPQGGGFKSLNVTTRKAFGLYANVRPCRSFHPYVNTKHPVMDVVIVRENEEDLYAGVEYQQGPDMVQAFKFISRPACEQIVRYAFEYAKNYGRKKVTCFTKDNILKMSDGLFHKIFDEIAKEYPDIENEHWIVDIGAAKLADSPEAFDVIVMPNLYGDILSDVAAQIAGSVGMAGSANIGESCAMFEAIHGSAPRRAGQNLANPSGLINGAILMLLHIGQAQVAQNIHNAWLSTLEDGIHTYDVFQEGVSKEKVGTAEFASAVIERLGKTPKKLAPVDYSSYKNQETKRYEYKRPKVDKKLVGIDVLMPFPGALEELADKVKAALEPGFELELISTRGQMIWPTGQIPIYHINTFRARIRKEGATQAELIKILANLDKAGMDIALTSTLCTLNGEQGFTKAQGQ